MGDEERGLFEGDVGEEVPRGGGPAEDGQMEPAEEPDDAVSGGEGGIRRECEISRVYGEAGGVEIEGLERDGFGAKAARGNGVEGEDDGIVCVEGEADTEGGGERSGAGFCEGVGVRSETAGSEDDGDFGSVEGHVDESWSEGGAGNAEWARDVDVAESVGDSGAIREEEVSSGLVLVRRGECRESGVDRDRSVG